MASATNNPSFQAKIGQYLQPIFGNDAEALDLIRQAVEFTLKTFPALSEPYIYNALSAQRTDSDLPESHFVALALDKYSTQLKAKRTSPIRQTINKAQQQMEIYNLNSFAFDAKTLEKKFTRAALKYGTDASWKEVLITILRKSLPRDSQTTPMLHSNLKHLLIEAAKKGDNDLINHLLESTSFNEEAFEEAITEATCSDSADIVKLLLEKGRFSKGFFETFLEPVQKSLDFSTGRQTLTEEDKRAFESLSFEEQAELILTPEQIETFKQVLDLIKAHIQAPPSEEKDQ